MGDVLKRTLLQTAGQIVFEEAIKSLLGIDASDSSSAGNENVGRAVSLGLSVVQRSNIAAVGVDAAVNEIQLQLSRQFPNERYIVIGVTNFFTNILQVLYEPALAALTD